MANQGVEVFEVESKSSLLLDEFRKNILRDEGAPEGYWNLHLDFSESKSYFERKGATWSEECWKYGNCKWGRTEFDQIVAARYENKVVSMSGAKRYGRGMLRVAMRLYTLEKYRTTFRSIMFGENGFFQHHLDFAKRNGGIDCLFLSIYPHNSRLKALVKNFSGSKVDPRKGSGDFVKHLMPMKNPVNFYGVHQHLYFYPVNPNFVLNEDRVTRELTKY